MNALQKTGEMLLPSVAYGDAAGFPVETKSFRHIEAWYGQIGSLQKTEYSPFYEGEWPAGTWTDDTELSEVMAKALIAAEGFDLNSIASEHVAVFEAADKKYDNNGKLSISFYGRSTTDSLQRLAAGVSPEVSGKKDGTGNGIIMKMAPLAYWQHIQQTSPEDRYRQYDALTSMTHDGDVARICTRVHGDVLAYLLQNDFDATDFNATVFDSVARHEAAFGQSGIVSDSLEFLRTEGGFSPERVKDLYLPRSVDVTDRKFGFSYSFYVPETLAVAYAAFLHGEADYEKSVYTAVNLGGDADSTASIVVAMVNFAQKGEQTMPADLEKIDQLERLQDVSRQLASVALQSARNIDY